MRFIVFIISLLNVICDDWWLVELGSLHSDLLALALVVISKNGYLPFFASLTLTLSE